MNETTALIIALTGLLGTIPGIIAAVVAIRVSFKVTATQSDVKKIELATNSMKDALVAATAKASLAEGLAAGRAEVTAENATGARAVEAERKAEEKR